MKRKNAARNAVVSSIISLLLCISMLVGTTFAWFTDSVTSASNIIASGNLDVMMQWADGTQTVPEEDSKVWADASTGAIFNYDLWEPGYTEVRHIQIRNTGTLALKYKVSILANGVIDDSNGVKLSDVIDVYYVDPAVQVANRSALTDAYKLDTLTNVLGKLGETGNGELLPGASDTITIALKMKESAGNEYMNKSIGTDFIVQLVATQLTHEIDSFDDQYDADAATPVYTDPVPLPESGPMTIGDDTIRIILPEDLVNDLRGKAAWLRLRFAEPKASNKFETIVFDYADVVDQDDKVVDLTDNDKYFDVELNVSKKFAEGDMLQVFHDYDHIASCDVDENGYITYKVKHLCKIDIVDSYLDAYQKEDGKIEWTDNLKETDKRYPSDYEELVAGWGNSTDCVLTGDVVVGNVIYFGTDTSNTIDLNGRTVTTTSDFVFGAQGDNCKLTVEGIGTVQTGSSFAGFVSSSGILTINGGTYKLGATGHEGNFFVQNSGTLVINGGNFISADSNTPIAYCINGSIVINGGFFQNTANPNQALLSMGNNPKYAKNQKITLSGGTFVNWNPMNSAFAHPWTNPDVPAMIVLADGYQMISESQANGDIWYTVVPI